MKVKKNRLFIVGLSIFVLSIILMGAAFYLISNYEISINEGRSFVQRGFSINPADKDEIEEYTNEFEKNIDILYYELNIELFPLMKEIECQASITGIHKVKSNKEILLNFNDGFEITNILLNNNSIDYLYKNDRLLISGRNEVSDTFNILINYHGKPESLGFGSFIFGEHKDESVVYTLNEPIFASTWFPCNDIPSDKVLTDVYITNDSSKTSLSNGILVDTKISGKRKTYHWKTNYPISTYLISIYSADYEHFSDKYVSALKDTMFIDYYVFEEDLKKAKKDFDIHINAIKHFSTLFGEYPFIKEKYGVAQFLWKYGAMEHQTITGIGKDFVSGNRFFTDMLVHELAHQWWGNAVTLKTWKDIWLNEGFSTYSEALYWEQESGSSSLKSTMRSFLTNFDGLKLYDPDKLFSRIIYNKGAWVLHMLRGEIGDKLFFYLLQNYFETYKYKNASTEDFINLAEKISSKNLKKFFDQWVFNGEGKIELEYSYSTKKIKNSYELNLKLNQVQEKYQSYHFLLDVDIHFEDGSIERERIKLSDRTHVQKFMYEKLVSKIELDPDFWLAAEFHRID